MIVQKRARAADSGSEKNPDARGVLAGDREGARALRRHEGEPGVRQRLARRGERKHRKRVELQALAPDDAERLEIDLGQRRPQA